MKCGHLTKDVACGKDGERYWILVNSIACGLVVSCAGHYAGGSYQVEALIPDKVALSYPIVDRMNLSAHEAAVLSVLYG